MRDKITWVAAVGALSLGIVIGFFGGRGQLAGQWSRGRHAITKAEHDRSAAGDANPTPAAGEKVFVAMPIGRMRKELTTLTPLDPLLVTVAAVGAGEEGYELHLVVENHGACDAVGYSGVAYGFDPWGGARRAESQRRAVRRVPPEGRPRQAAEAQRQANLLAASPPLRWGDPGGRPHQRSDLRRRLDLESVKRQSRRR